MANTIHQALQPLFLTCFIFGVSVYPVKQSGWRLHWNTHLSILYPLIIWSLLICIAYYGMSFFSLDNFFFSIANYIFHAIGSLTTIASTFMNFYYQKRLVTCMSKLDAVDNTLEELGTQKIYQKLYTWSKCIIIVWLALIFLIDGNNARLLISKRNVFWGLTMSHLFNHCIHINMLIDVIFIIFLWYIGNRFDKINGHIQCLFIRNEFGVKRRSNKPIHKSTNNYRKLLWTSMHLHLELCHIAREWNTLFGLQLTLEILSSFIFLTAAWYHIFIELVTRHFKTIPPFNWFVSLFYAFLPIVRVYITNYVCADVGHKANEIGKTIHQLTDIIQYADVRKEIYQFNLQIMFHRLTFTGMGLFQFGHKFLWKFYIAITSYVIFMLQLQVHNTLSSND